MSDTVGNIELSTVGVGSIGDAKGFSLGTYLSVDDVNEVARLQSEGTIFIGDDDWVGYGNGTHIEVNDTNQQISMSATLGVYVSTLSTGAAIDVGADKNGKLQLHSSDERLKKDIFEISQSLDTIKGLRGVTYKWKTPDEGNARNNALDTKTYYGFIAQEVTSSDAHGITFTDREGFLGLNLSQVIPILVNAVKELEERVTELENK